MFFEKQETDSKTTKMLLKTVSSENKLKD